MKTATSPEQFVALGFTAEQSAFIAATVDQSKAEILRDIADGTVPADVPDFGTLHDYVDANCYGGLCDDDDERDAKVRALFPYEDGDEPDCMTAREMGAYNAVQNAVNAWILAGRPE